MPPSALTAGRWLAEDAAAPKRWRIGTTTAVTLLTGLRGQERATLVEAVCARTGLGRDTVGRLVDDLLANGLLTRPDADGGADHTRQARFDAIRRRWRRFNWTEAVEYHAGTLDYPFLDYAAGGRLLDSYRMRGYVEAEPDTDRHKRYPSAPRIPLPAPTADLVPGGVAEALAARPTRPPDAAALSAMLSLTFGKIDQIDHGRWQRAPMMRRTSPSGGARHPCEGYAIVLDVPGLAPGAYHVDPAQPALERIRPDVPEPAALAAIVPIEFHRFDHEIAAVIVVTCVFARNMYRYREPRTFRTVHNDAGHLAATAAMAAAATGLRCQVEYAGDDQSVESYLGLDGLNEGFMLTLSLLSPEPSATARARRLESLGASQPQLTRMVQP
jgi:SagB-type dehydrogenase family enzyme